VKVFLIGLPGSGKSMLGKQIAKSINLPFIDLDECIYVHEGLTIGELFKTKGQHYFRRVEAEVLREQIKQPEFVMATGGGTPCFFGNMELINSAGTSIYLETSLPIIASRFDSKQKDLRPMFSNVVDADVEEFLTKLLQIRKPFYEQSHFKVNGDTITAWEIIQLVMAASNEN
jgi:shikimate kinase